MGRSRLAYRSKHKGILSEHSRKEIQDAKRRKQEKQEKQEEQEDQHETIEINQQQDYSTEEIEEEIEEGGIDIFEEPKPFYLENEYSQYVKEIHMSEKLQNPILCVFIKLI